MREEVRDPERAEKAALPLFERPFCPLARVASGPVRTVETHQVRLGRPT